MDVCMRHLHAEHGNAYPLAGEGFLLSRGDTLGKELQSGIFVIRKIEDIIDLAFRYHKRMTGSERADIEEGLVPVVLSYLI